jgi:hypothetical protein
MARVTPPTVMPSSSTKRTTADFEFVSEPAARPPLRGVGHQSGIVFPFGKPSTKPNQAHARSHRGKTTPLVTGVLH